MAIKKRIESSFVAFDVVYEDGTLSSNRKVPSIALGGIDGDLPAKAIIAAQESRGRILMVSDDEILSHLSSYFLEHLDTETHTILKAASVLVGALVGVM